MIDQDEFNKFFDLMRQNIDAHKKVYGDSWKHQDVSDMGFDFLTQRLDAKFKDFKLTKNTQKLISLANLAMLLYIRETVLKKKEE